MIIDFTPTVSETIPNTYSWDKGVPLELGTESITISADTQTGYISGYAPFMRVYFKNISEVSTNVPGSAKLYTTYEWDFGDFYNSLTNRVALSCPAEVRHTYIMPGKYTVTLNGTRSVSQQLLDITDELCFGKYNINWYWDRFIPLIAAPSAFNAENFSNTWNETAVGKNFAKQWDDEFACYQKYCKYWSWENLQSNKNSQVTWDQTKSRATFEKKWQYEANDTICSTKAPNWYTTTQTEQQVATKYFIVEVKEIPPTAGMFCTSQILTGYTPYTITLTPRSTLCGSFPIDRIDWDFDDGSPLLTVVRQNTVSRVLSTVNLVNTDELTSTIVEKSLTADFIDNLINISPYPNVYQITDNNYPEITGVTGYTPALTSTATIIYTVAISSLVTTVSVIPMPGLIYNGSYFDDVFDPRNFDIEHTYYRNNEIYPVFYPSLTAYSSSTGTYDSCSTTVGPILLNNSKSLTPIKVINNQKETQYLYNADNVCTILTTITAAPKTVQPKLPSNRLVNDFYKPLVYRGNNGNRFIVDEPPNCAGYVLTAEKTIEGTLVYTGTTLVTQESATIAITQEDTDFILL
jgi:hypothetical protein